MHLRQDHGHVGRQGEVHLSQYGEELNSVEKWPELVEELVEHERHQEAESHGAVHDCFDRPSYGSRFDSFFRAFELFRDLHN